MIFKDKIASLCHDQWSHWIVSLLGKGTPNADGTLTVPKDVIDRWRRQMNTPYDLLSDTEKDLDKVEADKFLKVIAEKSSSKLEDNVPDPRVKLVILKWIEYCENIKGFKPEIGWGMDGAIVKKRLGRFTPEQLYDLFDFYLNSEDCKRLGCSLKIALGNYILNKYLINNNPE